MLSVVVVLSSGCAQFPRDPLVHQPMTARSDSTLPVQTRAPTGAIFQAAGRDVALFEDRRPRNIGDILTIVISEKLNASKNSGANASRDGAMGATFATIPKFLTGLLDGQSAKLSGTSTLNAKGGANAANNFNSVITVTVTDVLGNGNLLVSGEKQMGINQGTEFIRFSGVVNPRTVTGNNTVLSTQVADARIEYTAKGYIDEAQNMGWMQRFFLNVSPF
ncbi:flagellar basal body L-ring protein FlgH [Variovorax sp. GT1P44]|uniref:flagellar basal body L-ring protein FlgH n=1 Tax=Variovorax sp. GT1P44 TaxID=3443742 RepID=UPI003F464F9B